jgi:hypothetical protein
VGIDSPITQSQQTKDTHQGKQGVGGKTEHGKRVNVGRATPQVQGQLCSTLVSLQLPKKKN